VKKSRVSSYTSWSSYLTNGAWKLCSKNGECQFVHCWLTELPQWVFSLRAVVQTLFCNALHHRGRWTLPSSSRLDSVKEKWTNNASCCNVRTIVKSQCVLYDCCSERVNEWLIPSNTCACSFCPHVTCFQRWKEKRLVLFITDCLNNSLASVKKVSMDIGEIWVENTNHSSNKRMKNRWIFSYMQKMCHVFYSMYYTM